MSCQQFTARFAGAPICCTYLLADHPDELHCSLAWAGRLWLRELQEVETLTVNIMPAMLFRVRGPRPGYEDQPRTATGAAKRPVYSCGDLNLARILCGFKICQKAARQCRQGPCRRRLSQPNCGPETTGSAREEHIQRSSRSGQHSGSPGARVLRHDSASSLRHPLGESVSRLQLFTRLASGRKAHLEIVEFDHSMIRRQDLSHHHEFALGSRIV